MICLTVVALFAFPARFALAQTSLQRISTVERSDGQGYVIRYHLSMAVDSFAIRQPDPSLIQMKLYTPEIDTAGIRIDTQQGVIRDVLLHPLEDGLGVEFVLTPLNPWLANAYPDRNGHDLLLSLTQADQDDVIALANTTEPYPWGEMPLHSEPLELNIGPDDGFFRIQENLNFDTVIIDAGHGGKDPGTIGHRGLREKDITLAVAKKVGGYIEEYLPDVEVIYTRDDDTFVELQERGKIANRARGDLFVSIHANAFRRSEVKGSEIYFLGLARTQAALEVMKRENSVVHLEGGNGMHELSEEDLLIYELANAGNLAISERIAEKMEYQFRERARRPTRGVKQAQFVVLYHASMPALLVELGFITNPDEARFLGSEYGQSIVASAIFRAIRDYKVEYERSRNISRTY